MKTLIRAFLVLALAPVLAGASHVRFSLADFTTGVLANRRITITPISAPSVTGAYIITGDSLTYTSSITGILTVSNIVIGYYRCSVQGAAGNNFTIRVSAEDDVLYDAADLLVAVSVATSSGTTAWSQAASDRRYVGRLSGWATNLTVSNITMLGTVVGSNVTATATTNFDGIVVTNAILLGGEARTNWPTGGGTTNYFDTTQFSVTSGTNVALKSGVRATNVTLVGPISISAGSANSATFSGVWSNDVASSYWGLMRWYSPATADPGYRWTSASTDTNANHTEWVSSTGHQMSLSEGGTLTVEAISLGGVTETAWPGFVTNSVSQAGVVPAGTGNPNKSWRTDGTGIPAWRDPGGGVTSLSGMTNAAQLLSVGTNGVSPNWTSNNNDTSTINLPWVGNTIHGILSSNDWQTLSAKATSNGVNNVSNILGTYTTDVSNSLRTLTLDRQQGTALLTNLSLNPYTGYTNPAVRLVSTNVVSTNLPAGLGTIGQVLTATASGVGWSNSTAAASTNLAVLASGHVEGGTANFTNSLTASNITATLLEAYAVAFPMVTTNIGANNQAVVNLNTNHVQRIVASSSFGLNWTGTTNAGQFVKLYLSNSAASTINCTNSYLGDAFWYAGGQSNLVAFGIPAGKEINAFFQWHETNSQWWMWGNGDPPANASYVMTASNNVYTAATALTNNAAFTNATAVAFAGNVSVKTNLWIGGNLRWSVLTNWGVGGTNYALDVSASHSIYVPCTTNETMFFFVTNGVSGSEINCEVTIDNRMTTTNRTLFFASWEGIGTGWTNTVTLTNGAKGYARLALSTLETTAATQTNVTAAYAQKPW